MPKERNIYLDYAAATPVDRRVLSAMEPFFSEKFHNPSSDYRPAREANEAMEESRRTIAQFLGAKPAEIIFTAGGTEANNLAIFGVANKFPGSKVICSAIEHDSVIQPVKALKSKGHNVGFAGVDKRGFVDISALTAAIDDNTVLVSVMYANNEVGTIQPLGEIAKLLQIVKRDRRKRGVKMPLYLHSDACQATQYQNMQANRLGLDLMVINSDKIYGPKQCGALFVRSPAALEPVIFGGGQERGLRSGTPNVPSIIGFAKAIELLLAVKDQETARMKKLQKYFYTQASKIKGSRVNGTTKKRLPNNLNITFAGVDNEKLLLQLDEKGIYVSAGSACSASKTEPSYVLRAMGVSDDDIRSSIRFSMGRQTIKEDIDKTISAIEPLVV